MGAMFDITGPMALDPGFDPRSDVFNRLLKNRVIMLGTDVNDDMANQIWPQMGTYDKIKAKEVARAPLKRGAAPQPPADSFSIRLAPEKAGAAVLTLSWGDQSWTAELTLAK